MLLLHESLLKLLSWIKLIRLLLTACKTYTDTLFTKIGTLKALTIFLKLFLTFETKSLKIGGPKIIPGDNLQIA